ncbi:hypothetical protein PTSG_04858 [Salpingoeca rosetta]|uniref:Uncharacterized protein n=1 Tax=Salpingoeca rosetta (strain ATCC 50818 / BSB-021) TaxID=946362 RepID=F2U9W8_SALR5|nr:uncharacterized protein PTSG_04858 [Salpingoeca rosetta]EGD73145.1 hypothetical protein PTSG_04858 [Salpingoeca rosetta]|eukprot:XP_004994176.1 hypothetical protein PTSG_04858 [Salpingoeca rosetta]
MMPRSRWLSHSPSSGFTGTASGIGGASPDDVAASIANAMNPLLPGIDTAGTPASSSLSLRSAESAQRGSQGGRFGMGSEARKHKHRDIFTFDHETVVRATWEFVLHERAAGAVDLFNMHRFVCDGLQTLQLEKLTRPQLKRWAQVFEQAALRFGDKSDPVPAHLETACDTYMDLVEKHPCLRRHYNALVCKMFHLQSIAMARVLENPDLAPVLVPPAFCKLVYERFLLHMDPVAAELVYTICRYPEYRPNGGMPYQVALSRFLDGRTLPAHDAYRVAAGFVAVLPFILYDHCSKNKAQFEQTHRNLVRRARELKGAYTHAMATARHASKELRAVGQHVLLLRTCLYVADPHAFLDVDPTWDLPACRPLPHEEFLTPITADIGDVVTTDVFHERFLDLTGGFHVSTPEHLRAKAVQPRSQGSSHIHDLITDSLLDLAAFGTDDPYSTDDDGDEDGDDDADDDDKFGSGDEGSGNRGENNDNTDHTDGDEVTIDGISPAMMRQIPPEQQRRLKMFLEAGDSNTTDEDDGSVYSDYDDDDLYWEECIRSGHDDDDDDDDDDVAADDGEARGGDGVGKVGRHELLDEEWELWMADAARRAEETRVQYYELMLAREARVAEQLHVAAQRSPQRVRRERQFSDETTKGTDSNPDSKASGDAASRRRRGGGSGGDGDDGRNNDDDDHSVHYEVSGAGKQSGSSSSSPRAPARTRNQTRATLSPDDGDDGDDGDDVGDDCDGDDADDGSGGDNDGDEMAKLKERMRGEHDIDPEKFERWCALMADAKKKNQELNNIGTQAGMSVMPYVSANYHVVAYEDEETTERYTYTGPLVPQLEKLLAKLSPHDLVTAAERARQYAAIVEDGIAVLSLICTNLELIADDKRVAMETMTEVMCRLERQLLTDTKLFHEIPPSEIDSQPPLSFNPKFSNIRTERRHINATKLCLESIAVCREITERLIAHANEALEPLRARMDVARREMLKVYDGKIDRSRQVRQVYPMRAYHHLN